MLVIHCISSLKFSFVQVYARQTSVMKIGKSVVMQTSKMNTVDLSWFRPSHELIVIRPVLLYYFIKFDAPDILWTATFIVWRTAL
jgi:hypothetical protein